MHRPPSNKITITTPDVSRPRGKVRRCSFVIDLYCRHFVPYLALALIINHCFNKLRLPTQRASLPPPPPPPLPLQPPPPPVQHGVGSHGIFDGFVAGETTCHALGKANSVFCSTDSRLGTRHHLSDNISTRSGADAGLVQRETGERVG